MTNCIDCVWLLTTKIYYLMSEKEINYIIHNIKNFSGYDIPVSFYMEKIAIEMIMKGEY